MDKVFDNISTFDFFGIFAAGMIILTSSFFPFMNNIFVFCLSNDKNVPEMLIIFIYIIMAYICGLVLHSISAFLYDIKVTRFGLHNAFKECDEFPQKKNMLSYKIFNYFRYMRGRYVKFNPNVPKEDFFNEFYRHYNYLKQMNLSKRPDKYMAVYGMARSLSLGYFLLTIFFMVYCILMKEITFFIIIYFVLSVQFYMRAKKYYYRWIECIFIHGKRQEVTE